MLMHMSAYCGEYSVMLVDTAILKESSVGIARDVIPNFPVYTESCKQYADIIIPYMTTNPVALQTVASGIQSMLNDPHG